MGFKTNFQLVPLETKQTSHTVRDLWGQLRRGEIRFHDLPVRPLTAAPMIIYAILWTVSLLQHTNYIQWVGPPLAPFHDALYQNVLRPLTSVLISQSQASNLDYYPLPMGLVTLYLLLKLTVYLTTLGFLSSSNRGNSTIRPVLRVLTFLNTLDYTILLVPFFFFSMFCLSFLSGFY